MASSRLPGKPLADIAGLPMIVHVLRRAQAAKIGEAVVATDSEAVAAAVEKAGGRAIMTRTDHVSGSDRIYEALEALDPEHRIGIVVNVQGDLPTIDPADIRAALDAAVRSRGGYRHARRGDYRSVRTHQSECGQGDWRARRARPFSRHSLHPRQRHRPRAALSPHRALRLPARGAASASSSCRRRPTSSARGSSNCARSMPACASMSCVVKSVPLGVDTPEELAKARKLLAG